MTDRIYCPHCRNFHETDEVVRVVTSSGERWRCLKSSLPREPGATPRRDPRALPTSQALALKNLQTPISRPAPHEKKM